MGRDRMEQEGNAKHWGFNSRARMGRDYFVGGELNGTGVSTHAPAWGAMPCRVGKLMKQSSFNSRARMGRDLDCLYFGSSGNVSTHAPAWGAISAPPRLPKVLFVSTHAPAWGAISWIHAALLRI